MDKLKKNKILAYLFKTASVVVACFFPVWAICEKFPIWNKGYGTGRSVGVGAILMCAVFLIIFRKTVFGVIKEKLKLDNAPPIAIWLVLLVISYLLLFIANFLRDLTTVLWMGALGCALGNLLTLASGYFASKDVAKDQENGEVDGDE